MTNKEVKTKSNVVTPDDVDLVALNTKEDKAEIVHMRKSTFQDVLNGMQLKNKSFSVITGTSTTRIQIENKIYVFSDVCSFGGKGFHVCRTVKKDVMSFIEDNPDYEYTKIDMNDSDVSKVNHEEAVLNVGKSMYRVDLNDCYWDTIFKLGFITQKTYNDGLKEKKWKTGRNASIGALKKDEWIAEYRDGTLIERRPVENDHRVVGVRSEVMSHVHSVFLELMEILNNKYIMYFTDCLYVSDYGTALKCVKFFDSKGYRSKIDVYELDKADGNIVYWHDYKKNIAKFRKYGAGADGITYTIGNGNKIIPNKEF